MPTYYELLGVESTASVEEIKHAYRQLMNRHHPDRHGQQDDPLSRLINEAYSVLENPHARMRYDSGLVNSQNNSRNRSAQPSAPPSPKPHQYASSASERKNTTKPTMVDCEWCWGRGRNLMEIKCSECGGTGKQPAPPTKLSCQVKIVDCWHCFGKGKNLFNEPCWVCDSTGNQFLPPVGYQLCPVCLGHGTKKDEARWKCRPKRPPCDICQGTGLAPLAPTSHRWF